MEVEMVQEARVTEVAVERATAGEAAMAQEKAAPTVVAITAAVLAEASTVVVVWAMAVAAVMVVAVWATAAAMRVVAAS